MYKVCSDIQIEKEEMRFAFGQVMDELATIDKRVIYLDADIINSIKMVDFAKKYPDRTINCGVQEANMIGVAAGISDTGLIPYAHTFAPFATRRVMDQVFVSCAYAKLNVRIIGSDPGITAGVNGGTHIPLEDIGMMRGVPQVTIIEPTDSAVLKDMLIQTKDLYGVFYIRLSRKKSKKIYEDNSVFEIGKANVIAQGSAATIIANGICVADAIEAAAILKKENIHVRILDMFTIKPIDKEAIINAAKETGAIVSVENHNIINGLGSAIAEVLVENNPVPMIRLGARDQFGEVGDMDYLKEKYKMEVKDIVDAVKTVMRKK
ncbi:MAG: transketolase family protein [Dysgonomonas sp.]